ncbi:MAG: hypothetical protein Q9221_005912 [Calogaya cf. arnoldii]
MSGAEIVGIVLASLPLVIAAIEHYRSGLDPLQDYLRYNCTLKLLRTHLRIEQDLFEGSLRKLLLDSLTPDQQRNLFPDGGQNVNVALWGTDEIDNKLQTRLGRKFENFMAIVSEMESVMRLLMEGLEVEPNWEVSSENIPSIFKKGKWEWKKFAWGFSHKRREALLQRLEKCNQTLGKYVDQWEVLAPSLQPRANEFSKHYQRVRDDACKVYDALENSWKCQRPCSHVADLQLESRNSEATTPQFNVVLSFLAQSIHGHEKCFRWQLVETYLEVGKTSGQIPMGSKKQESRTMQSIDKSSLATTTNHGSSTSSGPFQAQVPRRQQPVKVQALQWVARKTSKLQGSASYTQPGQHVAPISSLCAALQWAQKPPASLGFLTNASLDQRIAISTKSSRPSEIEDRVSLDRLIAATKASAQTQDSFRSLSGRQRLSIAVALAHTVLQLYDSPWLSQSWGKKDIWFFASGVDKHKRPNVDCPYISRLFESPLDQSTSAAVEGALVRTELNSHLITNKSLFALGVVLIELALKKPFEDLCAEAIDYQPSVWERPLSIAESYQVATSLIDMVYDEQGTQYGYVVQRCLKCEFGFQDSKKRLQIDAFRAAVYEGVLAPLEEELKRYTLS